MKSNLKEPFAFAFFPLRLALLHDSTTMSPSALSSTSTSSSLRALVALLSAALLPLALLGLATPTNAATQADIIGTWSTGNAAVLTGPVSLPFSLSQETEMGNKVAFQSIDQLPRLLRKARVREWKEAGINDIEGPSPP